MSQIQVIVNCDYSGITKEEIEQIGSVKYVLPMIHSYVLEIEEENLYILRGLKGVKGVEQDAYITAQMEQAREIVEARWKYKESNLGKGIGVAILDTGIYPHQDFTSQENRIVSFQDFIHHKEQPYDDNGHGTHVAGILASDGTESNGKYEGIAPRCNIIALKVLSENGSGNISDVLAGLQWILDYQKKYNIRVVNMSVGMEDVEGETATLVRCVDILWDNGLVVVCAAGNNGPAGRTITTPGISRKVITVGSSNDSEEVHIHANAVMNYSGRGPTGECIKKPDLVAPGSNIISCSNGEKRQEGIQIAGYITKSGTSMATPIISGLMARVLSDYPNMINRDLKFALKYGTKDLELEQERQGWGLISFRKFYEVIEKMNQKDT